MESLEVDTDPARSEGVRVRQDDILVTYTFQSIDEAK